MVSDDIKRLYNTGYFSDVSVDRVDVEGGFKVTFEVAEAPHRKDFIFEDPLLQSRRSFEQDQIQKENF